MTGDAFELTWGVVATAGGTILALDAWGAAERFQAMSYAYRSWPASVTTCRVAGGLFMIAGVVTLVAALP
ncbi:hypothetical protein H9Y04_40825 [Streptomyces sp. TRM66268-LWL]|uniref:Uncharacterized protein n=1 Tax=Streptomyces polyasparticus TaxID=2767826 RepID=A0ABR7STT2_9ACTN|nr:hypothetical protein [Streptomyces polyasparticus]